jgi:RsiW-degrading membrane proteinase PrsW (M82 family)
MKEIVITTERQKKEFFILLCCFIGAIVLNIIGIIIYNTSWKELYTQWFTLLVLTVVLYFLILFFRVLFALGIRLFRRKKAA